MKKLFSIMLAVVLTVSLAACNIGAAAEPTPEEAYNQAVSFLESGNKNMAAIYFGKAIGYQDAKERSLALWDEIADRKTIAVNESHTVAILADNDVDAVGSNLFKRCNVGLLINSIAIDAGRAHTVGLKPDGTVLATQYEATWDPTYKSDFYNGQCDVQGEEWENIVAIAAGAYHTVGLKANGTMIATRYYDVESYPYDNYYGQCRVHGIRDVIAISAGYSHTVCLKADGTVVSVGIEAYELDDVKKWRDIVAISAGDYHTVGLKADGTVVAIGKNDQGQCNVEGWSDIVAISAGGDHTLGLRSDGTVVSTEYIDDPNEDWDDYNGQCDVSGWRDIVAIAAGKKHSVGLKSDGTMVAVGDDSVGRMDVSEWLVKLPS